MNLALHSDSLPKAIRDFNPEWGIVLGSGLGSVLDDFDAILSLPYSEVSGMPTSTVPGHAGRFVFGHLSGKRVVVAQGRVHLYEGRSASEVAYGVSWMASLGIKKLLLTNAAGSLRPDFPQGNWMLIRDHLNLTGASPLTGHGQFVDLSAVYHQGLSDTFLTLAAQENIPLHQGIYAGVTGPQYETPAEIRMLRILGADAVGMSTVIEAIQARALGLDVVAFSCITNLAAGLTPNEIGHDEVLSTAATAAQSFSRLLARAFSL